MEWNKIDQQWKENLADRQITPSAQGWDKLSATLDRTDKQGRRSSLKLWISIAASIVIGGIGVLYYMTPTREAQVISSVKFPAINKWGEKRAVQEPMEVESSTHTQLAEASNSSSTDTSVQGKKEKKIQKQVAEINEIEEVIKTPIVEESVEVFTEPEVKKPTRKIVVSSDDLLNQVEGEIEIEYRESVIKKLYDKTKKVIVERSN